MKVSAIFILAVVISVNVSLSAAKDLVCQELQIHNYPCESYEVLTEDGYVVTLHRIPPRNLTYASELKPFILMHGLIGSAADFILSGKQRSLGCMLHEKGYDVWLPNARGTTYSKRHMHYDSSSESFWNFTWHEIGYYDLPATIDFITNKTGHEKLHYVAHSQGSTIFLVMLSERPEYNDKIVSASLLAPVAFLANLESPPLRLMASESEKIETLLNHLGLHELFPSTALNQLGGHLFCGKGAPTQNLCILVTYLSVGFSDYEMDRSLFPKIFETTPAGISRKQFQHFGQLINSGKFQKFDYKSKEENYRRYGRKTPPEYNLRNIRVPLNLYYGNKDFLMAKQDVFRLATHLQNSRFTLTEIRGFNHIDLLYSKEAPKFIYKKILSDVQRNH